MQKLLLMVLASSIASAPAPASAQPAPAPQVELAAELQRLRTELEAARTELQRLRADVDQLKAAAETAGPSVAPLIEVLQSQVAEHAQTKVESASRFPLKLFGTIHSTVGYNDGEANWLDNPNIVAPPATPTGSFTSTLRQTRVGISAEGMTLGSWQASASVVLDFFGGIPAFQTGHVMGLPRLLYAFARFDRGGTAALVGQDDAMLAPQDPTSLAAFSFPLLFRSGNLYLRAPQARVEQRFAGSDTAELRGMFGIIAPIGGDFRSLDYTFVPPALGGERSRRPAVQGRLVWRQGDAERGNSVGVSGHYGRERPVDELLTSWAAAIDFKLQTQRVGLAGEIFTGDNLDAFGGALGQVARTSGGFIEALFRPIDRWQIAVGSGTDQPDQPVPLTRNKSIYGNVIFRPTPEIGTSFEYRWLETSTGVARRRNDHFNWALTYSF